MYVSAFASLLNTPLVLSDLVLLASLANPQYRGTNFCSQGKAPDSQIRNADFAPRIKWHSSEVHPHSAGSDLNCTSVPLNYYYFLSLLLDFRSQVSNCHLSGSDHTDKHMWLKFNCRDEISIGPNPLWPCSCVFCLQCRVKTLSRQQSSRDCSGERRGPSMLLGIQKQINWGQMWHKFWEAGGIFHFKRIKYSSVPQIRVWFTPRFQSQKLDFFPVSLLQLINCTAELCFSGLCSAQLDWHVCTSAALPSHSSNEHALINFWQADEICTVRRWRFPENVLICIMLP